jgi:hypothetical protein
MSRQVLNGVPGAHKDSAAIRINDDLSSKASKKTKLNGNTAVNTSVDDADSVVKKDSGKNRRSKNRS